MEATFKPSVAMLRAIRQRGRLIFDRLFWRRRPAAERLGGDADWWVCPELLPAGSTVLSGGAGKDVSFELELVRRGCRVAVFDPSPTGARTMGLKENVHPLLQFFATGLAARESTVRFAPPANPAEGSFRVATGPVAEATVEFTCVTPKRALELAGFAHVDLCKLDIEGFEYEVLASLLDAGLRPAQVAVEFHHFMPGIGWGRTLAALRHLHRAGYRIVRKRQTDYLFVRKEFLG